MADKPAKRYQDELQNIKKCVNSSHIWFKPNIKRFHKFQNLVFESTIDSAQEAALNETEKAIIQFNIVNSPISRLCGEFSKQEPSIYVQAENGAPVDAETIEVIEGHIRHILDDAKKRNSQYMIYKEQVSGGFSNFKLWTDYANEMSFDQVIKVGKAYESTMVGFDPNAREITKCDGQYCFEIFPIPKDQFQSEYPHIDITDLSFAKDDSCFNWAYDSGKDNVVIVCDFYKRKKKKLKIVKLANDMVMTVDEYDEFIQEWTQRGFTAQPPAIVDGPRATEIPIICRYRVMGTEVIEYKETNFRHLPLVFADGDSVILQDQNSNNLRQFCKPYVYHAEGIQNLVNLAGQAIATDFENMTMHKWIISEEALPTEEEWLEAYRDPQVSKVMVYKQYMENEPDKQLLPPREVQRVPLPPEVTNTFNTGMQMLQNILGSYDASLGINDNQLSGVAIVEGATQSNASAMPYIVGHMQALTQVAVILLDMIPKLYKTPRTIPIIGKDGRRSYRQINTENTPKFNYDENALSVRVEAGVSFAISKNQALQQITALMNSSPQFAQFMSENGLDILLDNMDFRGIDIIKEKVKKWEMQQAEMRKKMQEQPSPQQQMVELQKQELEHKKDKEQSDAILKAEQLNIEKQKVDNDRLEILQKAGESRMNLAVGIKKAEAEEARAKADLAMRHKDMTHNHYHDAAKILNDIRKGASKRGGKTKELDKEGGGQE